MRILIGCETSGRVRDAFRRAGHDAVSCDLLPTDAPGPHIQGDILDAMKDHWDMLIAHPPCTYLCVSGLHWNHRRPGRDKLTAEAIRFAERVWDRIVSIGRGGIENPIGCLSTRSRLGKPTQIIQPYQFGENASKATCLWLHGLDPLTPTEYVEPRMVDGLPRWANQTDSGQNKLPPSADRWKLRSETYQGVADAMADQWSGPQRVQMELFG